MDDFIHLLKDFDCSYSVPGVSRFRVNICRQRGTFSIVLNAPGVQEIRLFTIEDGDIGCGIR